MGLNDPKLSGLKCARDFQLELRLGVYIDLGKKAG